METQDPTPPAAAPAAPNPERKTLDDRAKMTELERIRHSCAHVLATAILRLWPDAQFAYGPPVENGFYYDLECAHRISPEDFAKLEEEMKKEIKANNVFEKLTVTREQAIADAQSGRLGGLAERPGNASKFKLDLLKNIPEGEPISYFKNGDFIDLCAGPHEWLKLQEEAKRRDHRKIGAEMNLFAFDADFTGPGLPLWLPKGGAILEELEKLAKETEFQAGYVRVKTPHLAREKMYKTSGHLPYYADSMFPPMQLTPDVETGEQIEKAEKEIENLDRDTLATKPVAADYLSGVAQEQSLLHESKLRELESKLDELLGRQRYYLKAMNCPHHHRIFAAEPHSYRDLPLRLAEYGTCYRYEQSGELFGLMRVRSMNMNDAHIYCTPEQFADEFRAVNEMYLKYFTIFGLGKYQMRFSTSSPEGLGKKYVNEPELWKQTEDMVRRVLVESGINFVEVANEAAFYGPKIDVQVWSAIGREFTIATNQVDFAVPAKFGLTYRDRDNTDKTPLCIHRAPLGTHERFIGFLIEHYAGNFPLWLAPDQVRVITLGDDAPLLAAGKALVHELRQNFVRADGDFTNEPIKAKIANAEHRRIHTMLVLGPRDLEAGHVSVRLHTGGPQGAKPTAQVVADILQSIKERRA